MLISANTTLKPAATTATAMPPSAVTSPSSPLITMMTTTINTSTTATSVLPVMSSSISTPPVSAESPTVQSLNITTNTKCDAPFGNETSPCNSASSARLASPSQTTSYAPKYIHSPRSTSIK
ncbi:hypothetical protein GQX74_014668 [Glossina fuscipes]|nr:hypothetical protein GQX74_014668 [Glossina fuscipes]